MNDLLSPVTFLPPDPDGWLAGPVTLRLRPDGSGTILVGRMPIYVRGGALNHTTHDWVFAEFQHAGDAGFWELQAALVGRAEG